MIYCYLPVTADGYTPISDITPYRPLPPVARTSLAAMLHPLQDHPSTPMSDTTNIPSSNRSQNTVQDADITNEEEETFVDAVENIATPPEAQTTNLESKLKSLSMEPSVPLRRSNSNFSLFSLPPNATWEPASREPENSLSMSLTVSTMIQM